MSDPTRDALEAADDVHPDSVMGIMKDVAIVTPEAVEAAFAEQRKRYEAQPIEDRLAGCEAQLAEYAQAFLKVTAERDALTAGWPTCSGKWVKGSGGHRVHEPCGAPATWMHPDDMYAYCDAHIVHHDRPDYWQRSEFFDRTAELTARLSNERDALIRERDGLAMAVREMAQRACEDDEALSLALSTGLAECERLRADVDRAVAVGEKREDVAVQEYEAAKERIASLESYLANMTAERDALMDIVTQTRAEGLVHRRAAVIHEARCQELQEQIAAMAGKDGG